MKKTMGIVFLLVLGMAGFLNGQIRIVSPNGGESWAIGSDHTISWTSTGVSSDVTIYLEHDYYVVGQVNSERLPGSTTSFRWSQVGKMSDGTWAPARTDYKIKIVAADRSAGDMSDGNFSLTPTVRIAGPAPLARRFFRITNPRYDLKVDAGTTMNIQWESSGYSGFQVAIALNAITATSPPAPSVVLGNAPVEAGNFTWNIPRTLFGSFRIRIIAVPDGPLLAESRAFLYISPPTRFRVIAPIGGEIYRPGDTITVRWEAIDVVPEHSQDAVILLMRNSLGCDSGSMASIGAFTAPIGAGECRIRIPSDAPGSAYYRVDITPFSPGYSARDTEIHHTLSACFTIMR